jgi:hypothetical protein
MSPYARIETPLTPEQIAENERLITAWEALTGVLESRDILWIEDMMIVRPTVNVEYVRAEGPEREPETGPFAGMVRMIPVTSPFRPEQWRETNRPFMPRRNTNPSAEGDPDDRP